MKRLISLLCALFYAGYAQAADLSVSVLTKNGAPVSNAVVTFHPDGGYKGAIKFAWPYRVAQEKIQFNPRVLIVPVGATVMFPNLDKVRHHVYSFSPGNKFELKLYGRDETHSYTFQKAGIAAIGCNIHDQMSAYIAIVDTPYAALTDAKGVAILRNASGAGEVRVWRDDIRAPGNRMAQKLKLTQADGKAAFAVELRPASSGGAHGMH